MILWRKHFLVVLLNVLLCGTGNGQEKLRDSESSDWGVVERVRGSEATTVVSDEEDATAPTADEPESNATGEESFNEEETDYEPIVESVTKETVEELGRKLVGGQAHVCLRCDKKNQLAVQVLGGKTLVGVTGVTVTRHILSRTSLQGGIGYGFGGLNIGVATLHFFREDSSLHLLTGLNASIKSKEEERMLEGLWMLVGLGSAFNTQVGLSYGIDFGITMAIFENVFNRKMSLCFGVLAQASCREPWRILPYITPIKIGYSF